MNPLTIPLIIALVAFTAAAIGWALAAKETRKARHQTSEVRKDLAIARRLYQSQRGITAQWQEKAENLHRKYVAKPERRDTRPVKDGRPTTPLQDRLDSMVNAVSGKRLSPVKHARNIAPQRSDDTESTTHAMMNGVVAGTLITGDTGTVERDPAPTWSGNFTAPDPAPSTSDWGGSHNNSGGGSYDSGSSSSSDSGSCGGGGE